MARPRDPAPRARAVGRPHRHGRPRRGARFTPLRVHPPPDRPPPPPSPPRASRPGTRAAGAGAGTGRRRRGGMMTRLASRISVTFLLAAVVAAALSPATARAATPADILRRLAVQDGGRIKPLDTF